MSKAHRVAYVIINGDTRLNVLHTCDNPLCCNPKHLYAGTQDDNIRDREICNRTARLYGEENKRAKLTESDVSRIRALYSEGWFQREIAEEYGIHQTHVSRICRKENWKHT